MNTFPPSKGICVPVSETKSILIVSNRFFPSLKYRMGLNLSTIVCPNEPDTGFATVPRRLTWVCPTIRGETKSQYIYIYIMTRALIIDYVKSVISHTFPENVGICNKFRLWFE